MREYDASTSAFTRADALRPESRLVLSEAEDITVHAPFRAWGSPIRVRVPWGTIGLWNVIASIQSLGTDEQENFRDNLFLQQEIKVENDPTQRYWLVSARCFFTFWNPPNFGGEPGIHIRVRTLAVLA